MKCEELQNWMLTEETPKGPSVEVRSHLRSCADCRRGFSRLMRLLHLVETAPLAPLSAAPREQLLARLEPRPAAPSFPPSEPAPPEEEGPATLLLPPRRSVWTRWTSWAAAAIILLSIVGVGRVLSPNEEENPGPFIEKDADLLFADLEDFILERHLTLLETDEPDQVLHALNEMATEVRQESLLLARQHDSENLALLVWLHGRILHEGVLKSARSMRDPPAAILEPVLLALQQGEEAADSLRGRSPDHIKSPLRLLAQQSQDTANALRGGRNPNAPTPPAQSQLASRVLLQKLVMTSVSLATEKDPIRRVEYSTEAAEAVSLRLHDMEGKPDTEETKRLSRHLSLLCKDGVDGKLDRLDRKKLDEQAKKRMDQLKKKVNDARKRAEPALKKFSSSIQQHFKRPSSDGRSKWPSITKDRWPSPKKDRPSGGSRRR